LPGSADDEESHTFGSLRASENAMPANLTPQYLAAEHEFKQARTPEEKLKALKEMYALLPKHKGTEKLQGDIKRRMAKLREELHTRKEGRRRSAVVVDREGAGQAAVTGMPNSGKSQLVVGLTNASYEVADYAFTTRMPQPAMMPYEDIQIQLVDLPPLRPEHVEPWLPEIIKHADLVLLVVDLVAGPLTQLERSYQILRNHKVLLEREAREVEGDFATFHKTAFLVANKLDAHGAGENVGILAELIGDQLPFFPVSAKTGAGLETLRGAIFEALDVVRVYSKRPGKAAEMKQPFVFPRGSVLLDFAQAVHRDFAAGLKYARVWGREKFEGQRVTKDYILEDGDVIELHT
jgi:ribosome-interacting GTPase 1